MYGGLLEFRIVRSNVGLRGERTISFKGVKISPYQTRFKIVRLTTIHNRPKRTISINSKLERLQMILESVIGRCETLVRIGLDPVYNRHVLKP